MSGADLVSGQEAKDGEIEQYLLLPLTPPHRELNYRQHANHQASPRSTSGGRRVTAIYFPMSGKLKATSLKSFSLRVECENSYSLT